MTKKKTSRRSKTKHPAAVALGKLGAGKRKTMTPAAVEARRQTARTRKPSLHALKLAPDFQLPPGPLQGGDEHEVD